MSRTNETRHIILHETCKCKCRLDASVFNNKQRWNNDKWLVDKGVCDKGYIWNPSNYKCECDKSCDVGEYLDYENCKCRKSLIDKLVEEWGENVDEEVKILDKNEDKCSSCILYVVLFSIFFTINVGIATYFAYHKYINRNKENVSKYACIYHRKNVESYKMGEVKQINIENRTYYFYNDIIDIKNFESKLLKLTKNHTKTLVFTILDILQLKNLMIVKKFTA